MGVGVRSAGVLRPQGFLHTFDGDGPETVLDTVQCCHCGRHWVWEPGSGRKRGYCRRCDRLTCGNKQCDACVPIEQQLENREQGRDILYRPIVVSVAGHLFERKP